MRLRAAVVLFYLWIAYVQCNRLMPPHFKEPKNNKWLPQSLIKRPSETRDVACYAEGNPRPTYNWKRNGETVVPIDAQISFDENTGTLTLGRDFTHSLNGMYQCEAKNSQGTTMTPFYSITNARASTFPSGDGSSATTELRPYETAYQKITCDSIPASVPSHEFIWKRQGRNSNVNNEEPRTTLVVENERLVIDTQGNLHILWVLKEDSQKYTCGYHNSVIKTDMWSTKTTSVDVQSSFGQTRSPTLEFSENYLEVMAGTKAVLTCIFSYYTTGDEKFTVTWEKGGILLQKSLDYQYVIEFAQISAQDIYTCTGKLGNKMNDRGVSATIDLKIVSPPIFVPLRSPAPISVTKGDNAVFHCEATSHDSYANPPAWFKNGQPIVGCPAMTWECSEKMPDGSPQCLPMNTRCNRFPDCGSPGSSSDEQDCPGVDSCPENEKMCDGACVPNDHPCSERVCRYPDFLCANKESCIQGYNRCNTTVNCTDLSDEVACPNREEFEVNGYLFSSDRKTMTIPNVDLDDNQCIQCSVTNPYGTAFSDGCLTVIDQISILSGPESRYEVSPGMYLNLSIKATTDAIYASQLKYEWFYHPQPREEEEEERRKRQINQLEPILLPSNGSMLSIWTYFSLTNNNQSFTVHVPDVDETSNKEDYDAYMKIAGDGQKYSVVVSHRFDRVERNFTLIGEAVAPPVVVPVVSTASSNLWLIAVILGVIVLIALIIFIVCMVCRRDPRGAYYVDKKEHEAGNDPEQELKDSGFHDVGRVEDDDGDHPETEKISLSESVHDQYESDDETQEYDGDFDISSKFNEDGSFIGMYADKKKNAGSKEVTV